MTYTFTCSPVRQVLLSRGCWQRSTDDQRDTVLVRSVDDNTVAYDARRRRILLL